MTEVNNSGSNNSRILAGLFLLIIGVLFFFRQAGIAMFPYWVFTWPMILVAAGIFSGIKNGFRGAGWLVLMILGVFFLLDDVMNMYDMRRYIVPAILVAVGVMLIVRPKKSYRWKQWNRMDHNWKYPNFSKENVFQNAGTASSTTTENTGATTATEAEYSGTDSFEETLDATAIFGAVKKNILSKNFKGGDATAVFGGAEIDLSKADINGTVTIDVTAIMGGIKLIIPSHWTLRQEVAAVFGGVEDKREMSGITVQNKVLVLKGTAFMGGIEIKSYR